MRLFIFASCFAALFASDARDALGENFLRAGTFAPRRALFRTRARKTRFARLLLFFFLFFFCFFAIRSCVPRKTYLPLRKMRFSCSLAVQITRTLQNTFGNRAKRKSSFFCGFPQSFVLITLWISCGLLLLSPSRHAPLYEEQRLHRQARVQASP